MEATLPAHIPSGTADDCMPACLAALTACRNSPASRSQDPQSRAQVVSVPPTDPGYRSEIGGAQVGRVLRRQVGQRHVEDRARPGLAACRHPYNRPAHRDHD